MSLLRRNSDGRVYKSVESYTRVELSASQTVSTVNRVYACTAHSITVTLATSMMEDGGWVFVNDESGAAGGVGQAITVSTEGSETIDGNTSLSLNANNEGVLLYSDGANWFTGASIGTVL